MITKYLEMRINDAQDALDKFSADFAKNPAYAFQWADSAFRAAARIEIAKMVQIYLDDSVEVSAVIAELSNRVRFQCRNGVKSTSSSHNIMERYRLAELADIIEDLERWAK